MLLCTWNLGCKDAEAPKAGLRVGMARFGLDLVLLNFKSYEETPGSWDPILPWHL